MSATDPRTPIDDLQRIAAEIRDIARRLDLLEAPTGTSAYRTVAKLSALVSDIQAQLDAYNASRYTNADIDAKDNAVAAQINPAIASTLAGNVTIGGQFKVPDAYSTDITWTRRTAWWGNDGRAGYASSSRRKKAQIRAADADRLLGILDVEPVTFVYRAELEREETARAEGEDYTARRETGLIAEDLDEAGLGAFVYHDEDGQAEGIEYGMLSVALLAVARQQRDEIAELRSRLDDLDGGAK